MSIIFGDKLARQVMANIAAWGMPVLWVYHHGAWLRIQPDDHTFDEKRGGIYFYLDGQEVARQSNLGDLALIEKRRPDMLIVDCLKCYQAMTDHGHIPLEIAWLVKESAQGINGIK